MATSSSENTNTEVAVILPCYNEEQAISGVIERFRQALPDARIYVFDNNSSDSTSEKAREAGATVYFVKEKGKGNVVRRMFADIDADVYLMADGDLTYDAVAAPELIQKLLGQNLDMVVGCRQDDNEAENYRFGHRFGNRLLTGTVQTLFGGRFTDMLSGYRAFSRRFVKSFPAQSRGFEIETELTVHTLEQRLPYDEVMTRYFSRPEGSESKLSTYRDGLRILKTIARLFMIERPMAFYFIVAALLVALSVFLAIPLFLEYFDTGLVPRIPTAILCVGLVITGTISIVLGLLLDAVSLSRQEIRRMTYLSVSDRKL